MLMILRSIVQGVLLGIEGDATIFMIAFAFLNNAAHTYVNKICTCLNFVMPKFCTAKNLFMLRFCEA